MLNAYLALFFILVSQSSQAEPCRKALNNLLELYTSQNKEMLLIRIENASDKHKFLRSFIPYYYQRAYEVRETLPVYFRLSGHRGQIVGDAHVENFGFLINNKGKPKFTMNDFDDAADAPLFLDVLRLSQSASYVSDLKQAKALDAYKKGLMGKSKDFSPYTRKLEEKSLKASAASKAEYSMTKEGPRFSKKSEPFYPINSHEEIFIQDALQKKYGPIKLHDSYRTMKESGGSAFGTRYHALAEVNGKIHFIEFKEIMEGGVVRNWTKTSVTEQQRVENAMNTLLAGEMKDYLDVVTLNQKPYQIRFKLEGNKSIDLGKVEKSGMNEVIEDEFFLLGQIHRTSLGGTDAAISPYLKDLKKIKTEEWEESVNIMKKEIKNIYKDVN